MTDQTSQIRIGAEIRDNDPRMQDRVLGIIGFDPQGRAIACQKNGRGKVRILLSRIYTDGKPRRSGFSLVQEAANVVR